ncbi:MAG: cyclic nucleotide-binding domain-containing protein [Arenicellales bacterium]|jgi:CRP-like cAMP-binding protein
MNIAEMLGYVASLLVFASFYMKTMIPLRLVAITSNVAFMAYGFANGLYPVLLLHVTLFPLNLHRLLQIRRMVRRVEQAATQDLDFTALLPLMSRSRHRKGDALFKKGDHADRLYYLAEGQVSFLELGATVTAGSVIGEIGLFSPNRDRMATAVFDSDCEVYALSYTKIEELHYQNPEFGFTLLRLITARLLQDLQNAS